MNFYRVREYSARSDELAIDRGALWAIEAQYGQISSEADRTHAYQLLEAFKARENAAEYAECNMYILLVITLARHSTNIMICIFFFFPCDPLSMKLLVVDMPSTFSPIKTTQSMGIM